MSEPTNHPLVPRLPEQESIPASQGQSYSDYTIAGFNGRKIHLFTKPAEWTIRFWNSNV